VLREQRGKEIPVNIQEMRSSLEKGFAANRMGTLPPSMPDYAIEAVFNAEARRRAQLRKAQSAPVTRNAQRTGAITAPKATDEAERTKMKMQLAILQ
jgi:hypothetical protein